MMMTYSVAVMIVDKLESHADRPLTETEIEAGGLADLQAMGHPVQGQSLGSWIRLHWSQLLRACTTAAAGSAH